MKKPDGWYAFSHIDCELHHFGMSNMSPPSTQLYCKRKDRQGKDRPYWIGDKYYPVLKCHWNVCPKLKEQRKTLKKE